jgi:hypothetical protein
MTTSEHDRFFSSAFIGSGLIAIAIVLATWLLGKGW